MPEDQSSQSDAIERLLAERTKILRWLDRLAVAADDTPRDVRDRVKVDYETRLDAVSQELRGYTEALQGNLAELQGRFAVLTDKQKESETRMAEAKLRHAVGEYSETKWNGIHADILGELNGVRDEVRRVRSEIEGLEEVLALIQAPVNLEEEAPPPAPPAERLSVPEAPMTDSAKRRFDELAFLKSVTEDEDQGPAAAKAAGQTVLPDPHNGPTTSDLGGEEEGADPDRSGPHLKVSETPKKTLRCKECGAMNYPTEWYCERCGAELTAV